jgi:hypothetical protein
MTPYEMIWPRTAQCGYEPPGLTRRSSNALGAQVDNRDSTELAEVRVKPGGS